MTATVETESPISTPAEYESVCPECNEKITIGTLVARLNQRWVHAKQCWHKI